MGYLEASGDVACSLAELALKQALSVNYGELIFKHNDGTNSATQLTSVGSSTGVIITNGPNFENANGPGPEYVNQRSFNFEAMAEYPLTGTGTTLTSFEEVISYSGGGPIYEIKLGVNGINQKQLIYPADFYRATVQGVAFGYQQYPALGGQFGSPPVLWPNDLHGPDPVVVDLISPRRNGAGLTEFGVKWTHRFGSMNPLIAAPRLWPL